MPFTGTRINELCRIHNYWDLIHAVPETSGSAEAESGKIGSKCASYWP